MPRIVHPECTPACTHGRPNPGPPAQRTDVDWATVGEMVRESMRDEPAPPVSAPRPAPYDPAVFVPIQAEHEGPYPAPAVTSRDGVAEPGPPRAVATLQKQAEAAGWMTAIQYAHGCMAHGTTGRPLAARPSWALRMRKGDHGAVAVYRSGAWDTLYAWSSTTFYRRVPTITELRRRLDGGQ